VTVNEIELAARRRYHFDLLLEFTFDEQQNDFVDS